MSSQKVAMDVDPSTSNPSTSSDLMKLIDDANHITAVPETEQWTVRDGQMAWPCSTRTIAGAETSMLRTPSTHVKNSAWTCTCRMLATLWPKLMRDLESKASTRTTRHSRTGQRAYEKPSRRRRPRLRASATGSIVETRGSATSRMRLRLLNDLHRQCQRQHRRHSL
jgi:hypothetical protein